jgi:vitamin-K-epoxide reductase (warfarin-sensitive)
VQPAVNGSSATNQILFALIALSSLAGIVDSAIALQRHYAKSATTYCDFSQKFSCDVVNRSEYSEIAGIPVAGIGVAGYTVLLALSTFWRVRDETPFRLLAASLAGLAFALYLTYIEAYQLITWCILCLISLVLVFFISMLAAIIKFRSSKA